jgi:two-component system OmpR family sensor kinase
MVITEKGLVLADAANGLTNRTIELAAPIQAAPNRAFFWGAHNLGNRRMLLYAAVSAGQISGQTIYVALSAVERPLLTELGEIGTSLILAGMITLFVSLLVAIILARSIARPLTRLTRGTEAIAQGDYDHRVEMQGNDEIGRLATSFNTMAERVQRSRQMEKDFVANVSHELKTPLTSIQGFAQAILDGAVQNMEGAQHAAQTIFDETTRMTRLVGDLLTLARFESGQIPLAHETIDLAQTLPTWVERFRTRADASNQKMITVIEPLPSIVGDAGRLEQVVSNLIDNALKYNSPGGTVTVTAKPASGDSALRTTKSAVTLRRRVLEQPTAQWVTLCVTDTGGGISPDDLPRLFDRFYRGDKARVAGGTGLGLAIASEIVRSHGGRIEVKSELGHGSAFIVYLPTENGTH